MYQTGIFFKSSENLYGANAIMMMSLAVNESALGQSTIAIDKKEINGNTQAEDYFITEDNQNVIITKTFRL